MPGRSRQEMKKKKVRRLIHGFGLRIGTLLWFSKLTGFQDSEPDVASVGSAQRPGPVLLAAVFPEFIAREQPGLAEAGRQGDKRREWCGPQRSEDTARRALTAGHRGLRSREWR